MPIFLDKEGQNQRNHTGKEAHHQRHPVAEHRSRNGADYKSKEFPGIVISIDMGHCRRAFLRRIITGIHYGKRHPGGSGHTCQDPEEKQQNNILKQKKSQ